MVLIHRWKAWEAIRENRREQMEQLCLYDKYRVGDSWWSACNAFLYHKEASKAPSSVILSYIMEETTFEIPINSAEIFLTCESYGVGMTINEIKISEWKPKKGDVWHYMALELLLSTPYWTLRQHYVIGMRWNQIWKLRDDKRNHKFGIWIFLFLRNRGTNSNIKSFL